MKIKELRQKSDTELAHMLGSERSHIRTLRFSGASGKVKNVKEMLGARRTIARILTLIRMRAAEIQAQA